MHRPTNFFQVTEATATFPVQNFRKSFEEIRKQGYFLCVERDQLLDFSTENVRDQTGQIYAHSWAFHSEISKVDSGVPKNLRGGLGCRDNVDLRRRCKSVVFFV